MQNNKNIMKNLILIFIVGLSVVACNPTQDTESVKKQLEEKRSSLEDLSSQIQSLEVELQELNGDKSYSGKKVAVRTMNAAKKDFNHFFEATGEVESVNEAFISPEVNGQVVSINVHEGEKVKKGQILAKLNTSLIEKNIKEIETQLDFAQIMFNKQSDLWKRNIGSERQYLEAKNNFESLDNKLNTLKTQRDMSIITSPFAGVVEDVMIKKGELAGPGMMLMQVVSLDNLLIKTKLSESYLSSIHKGDVVDLSFPSYPDLKMDAEISRVGNVINKANRTFIVEIKLKNINNKLKPNMLVNVLFNDYSGVDNFVVPSILIKKDLQGRYLYVVKNEKNLKKAEKRYIETGRSYMDKSEVVSGLELNELIITDGYNNVTDGSVINLIK
jgi:RND family efflux transporter MFP subunit